ncbi:MAG: hypothetical protein R3C26_18635 [Calditrichia bacterium]
MGQQNILDIPKCTTPPSLNDRSLGQGVMNSVGMAIAEAHLAATYNSQWL